MARPKKNSETLEAKQRLIDAFWTLLETKRVGDITVGAIAEKAQCNRGTFYYHYADMNELVYSAIEGELLSGYDAVPQRMFRAMTSFDAFSLESLRGTLQIQRMSLLIEHGGSDIASEKAREVILRMWEVVLCPSGERLEPATRLIIEYAIGGIFGILSTCAHDPALADRAQRYSQELNAFVCANSRLLLEHVCSNQGIEPSEAIERLRMAGDLMAERNLKFMAERNLRR